MSAAVGAGPARGLRHHVGPPPVHLAAQRIRLLLHGEDRRDGVIAQQVMAGSGQPRHGLGVRVRLREEAARGLHQLDRGDRHRIADRGQIGGMPAQRGQDPLSRRHVLRPPCDRCAVAWQSLRDSHYSPRPLCDCCAVAWQLLLRLLRSRLAVAAQLHHSPLRLLAVARRCFATASQSPGSCCATASFPTATAASQSPGSCCATAFWPSRSRLLPGFSAEDDIR